MFFLKNLSSHSITSGAPWEFTGRSRVPERAIADKKARFTWISHPLTDHHVYTLIEGTNNRLRVSGPKGKEEGNPPFRMHGLAVDYDLPLSVEEVDKGVARMAPKLRPTWHETSLSGNFRLLWMFENPVPFASYEFALYLLKNISDFLPIEQLPGLDKSVLEDPARMLINGGIWRNLGNAPIEQDRIQGWVTDISAKFTWTGGDNGLVAPLDRVEAALKEKYPTFGQWTGDFALGAQGPSFWIAGSSSPKSAIVRETGIQTFSAHAAKGFYSWSDLLGTEFVSQFEQESMGKAVAEIFHDGKNYFRRLPDKSWKAFSKDDIMTHIRVNTGLHDRRGKIGVSPMDKAFQFIMDYQSIDGAGPFVFRPSGLIHVGGAKVLNTHSRRVLQPAPGPGNPDKFPTIHKFLSGFFEPHEQLDYFLSWLSYFYRFSHQLAPRSGQNIFIAGAAGVGKTMLNHGIIGKLLGGCVEAKEYLMGEDAFGSELFEVAHWVVDDSSATATFSGHRKFSEMIKRMAANRTFRFHAKFRIPMMVDWQGRVVITCNRDEESIRILPDLSLTILDKLMLFRSVEKPPIKFPDQEEMADTLRNELPHFARWLIEYEVPAHCRGESRFGIISYHDTALVSTAQQSSRTAGFKEILDDWKSEHFGHREPKADSWCGTALQLHKAIHVDPTVAVAMRSFDVDAVGRALSALKQKGVKIVCEDTGDVRKWTIFRDDKPVLPPDPQPIPDPTGKSKFQS